MSAKQCWLIHNMIFWLFLFWLSFLYTGRHIWNRLIFHWRFLWSEKAVVISLNWLKLWRAERKKGLLFHGTVYTVNIQWENFWCYYLCSPPYTSCDLIIAKPTGAGKWRSNKTPFLYSSISWVNHFKSINTNSPRRTMLHVLSTIPQKVHIPSIINCKKWQRRRV